MFDRQHTEGEGPSRPTHVFYPPMPSACDELLWHVYANGEPSPNVFGERCVLLDERHVPSRFLALEVIELCSSRGLIERLGSELRLTSLGIKYAVDCYLAKRAELAGSADLAKQNCVRLEGDQIVFLFDGRTVTLAQSLGMSIIFNLIEKAGQRVPLVELEKDPPAYSDRILDRTAIVDIENRAKAIAFALASGEIELGDKEELEEELAALHLEKRKSIGLGGRSRHLGSAANKQRARIGMAIKRALDKIEAAHEPLGRHLRQFIVSPSGSSPGYLPGPEVQWLTR